MSLVDVYDDITINLLLHAFITSYVVMKDCSYSNFYEDKYSR